MLPQTPHLLLHLLAAIASAIGVPNCVHPAPPPASLPTIADCHRLLRLIAVVARLQHDTPLTWSRDPPQTAGQQLPAYFSSGSGNECEFVVDVDGGAGEEAADVFPTGDVVVVGRDIVQTCLDGEAGTVGSSVLGPREVMRLWLRRKGVGGSLDLVNGTVPALQGIARAVAARTPEDARE